MFVRAAALAAALVALVAPGAALGSDANDDEARVRVGCLGGRAELRVRAEDDGDDDRAATLEVELRVEVERPVRSFRVVLLHERRLIFEGTRRASGSGDSLRLRRIIPDWPGRETVTARVTAPSGRTCRLAATI
jgi:hypothetical protein